ncbi:hypothetical protein GA0070607_5319 [Micromonospora coriariae]|uniref:DUF3558 domain-containing protein n=1 Tax=Micromonospora coriariae TaxID=285665 RepID=A0A1C4XIS7_9ACTN|nr:hypothetical protein [Micromonospora coriariae]SCF08395.1 hypothetical protein GA0070607_5319 [Micromonospora coriariae]
MTVRRLIAPLWCSLLLLPLVACGPDDTGGADPAAGAGVEADAGGDLADLPDVPRPACPFTAAKVTELVGQPMKDQGNCLFGDGKGVAMLTITTASPVAGETTYDYQRQQATASYREVQDVDKGRKAYLAVKDIGGEAVVVSDTGSYTVTLSSFERLGASTDGYERTLRQLLDALPL